MAAGYDRNVFINCPFDKEYDPLLRAIAFCLIYMGFSPRFARERGDSAEVRLHKIEELIESSRYSIHDLSRAQAKRAGEHYRLNMPFELGLDYGCRHYMAGRETKRILVLEEKPYRYQASLSDLAGCDIETHDGDYERAIRKVRNWLVGETAIGAPGGQRIVDAYIDFQGWYLGRQRDAGFSDDDIKDYSTPELLAAMAMWVALGAPT